MPSSDVPVTPIGGPSARASLIAIGVVAAALAVAVIKPWDGSAAGPLAAPASGALASPSTAPSPAPQPPVADSACQPAGEWRLFTIESNAGQPLRTWYSLKPRAAAGPTDPSIPTIRIYTEGLQRLGYCAASSATVPPVILSTAAWQIVAGRVANAIPLIRAVEPDLDDPNAGALYSPPTSGSISPHTWPVGRYVFVVRLNGYPGGLWFAAQVSAVKSP